MIATQPQQEASSGPNITEAFIADRQIFWKRFTSFTTGAVVIIVLLLIGMWLFLA